MYIPSKTCGVFLFRSSEVNYNNTEGKMGFCHIAAIRTDAHI
jgi:hypothetical protein